MLSTLSRNVHVYFSLNKLDNLKYEKHFIAANKTRKMAMAVGQCFIHCIPENFRRDKIMFIYHKVNIFTVFMMRYKFAYLMLISYSYDYTFQLALQYTL